MLARWPVFGERASAGTGSWRCFSRLQFRRAEFEEIVLHKVCADPGRVAGSHGRVIDSGD
jgi:hypothetical protein